MLILPPLPKIPMTRLRPARTLPCAKKTSRICLLALQLCLLCALALCGCSSSSAPTIVPPGSTITPGLTPDTMAWNFAPRALVLHIKADPQLNFADDQSHTLRLIIYQVQKLDAFTQLAATKEGLSKLMEGKSFDKSVCDIESMIITPGQVETLTLDRAEGAKHVAVVAGYYQLEPGMVSRTFSVPAAIYEDGILFKTKYYYPGPLEMILLFGPSSLQRFTQPVESK